ncbi:glycosyl transferase [Basidiobolus meristosporus CBS 931.73]|uniref:Alpha-1,4 glucan phosphorylase n=1 Tax=Basidiobolus meristosporus CBS 931.73 TaxID=1314790 RepID=A0A1Y1ZB67_9FUNG|nr:glycosyl transferase [Basidiobolus meristosporus CBS 931.73]|eukprot:ORY07217.1 glycosyl transferase [Basidiobolus meristosporus CBS 931.73]
MNGGIPERPRPRRRSSTVLPLPVLTPKYEDHRKKFTEEERKLWNELIEKNEDDITAIQTAIARHMATTLARTPYNVDDFAGYLATAYSVRDRLIKRWNETQEYHTAHDPKRVYYLSMEFLIGRSLDNALLALGLKDNYKEGVKQLGFTMEDLIDEEKDAALGNGGLGRLAACYMDSLATLDYPAWGYGIRYNYGMFQQKIVDGFQTEVPDYWLNFGNPWELPRLDISVDVRFYGYVDKNYDGAGRAKYTWDGGQIVQAVAYDVPIPGYDTKNCINIRLWSSKPTKSFDLESFNEGDYDKSVGEQKSAENITSVLYPNDNHMVGKELRLKQEYFFVCATLHDIIRRFKKTKRPWREFPEQVAIQLNDTHPTLGIPELQRLLIDEEGLEWDAAWDIVSRTYAFTNHTILPEAMEKWSVPMLEHVLPRHMMIIYDINLFFLQSVEKSYPGDRDLLNRISIIEESSPQNVRMAHLAIVGSHRVNGVAALHSDLIQKTIFKDFVEYYGQSKFENKTNGVTPRRWLHQCNPGLSDLITKKLGDDKWATHLTELAKLKQFADDKEFQKEWMAVKKSNKERLAKHIEERCGVKVNPEAMFDVQVKRIHEYKRQYMNILSVIYRYSSLKAMSKTEREKQVPRVVIFGGKAAPGYYVAKLVIKLINSVADVVNADKEIGDLLKVVFIPDYNVSIAEVIIPASDISQHISTAGTEASGTSNMKFVLNGGIILGTVDGANVEINEEIGDDNIFTFGVLTHEVDDYRHAMRYRNLPMDPQLQKVLDVIYSGVFGDPNVFAPLLYTLQNGGDVYLVSVDFPRYLKAQAQVDEAYKNREAWAKKSIMCTAGMAKFSSDRAIKEYAESIWNIKPCRLP